MRTHQIDLTSEAGNNRRAASVFARLFSMEMLPDWLRFLFLAMSFYLVSFTFRDWKT